MNRKSFNRIFFEDKEMYKKLDDDTKREFYFMFNRCMSRLLPLNSDALNNKNIDYALASDIWSIFFKSKLKEPDKFEPEWWKYSKKKSLLDGFNKTEQYILNTYYNEHINDIAESIENDKEIGKIEKKKYDKIRK